MLQDPATHCSKAENAVYLFLLSLSLQLRCTSTIAFSCLAGAVMLSNQLKVVTLLVYSLEAVCEYFISTHHTAPIGKRLLDVRHAPLTQSLAQRKGCRT